MPRGLVRCLGPGVPFNAPIPLLPKLGRLELFRCDDVGFAVAELLVHWHRGLVHRLPN